MYNLLIDILMDGVILKYYNFSFILLALVHFFCSHSLRQKLVI